MYVSGLNQAQVPIVYWLAVILAYCVRGWNLEISEKLRSNVARLLLDLMTCRLRLDAAAVYPGSPLSKFYAASCRRSGPVAVHRTVMDRRRRIEAPEPPTEDGAADRVPTDVSVMRHFVFAVYWCRHRLPTGYAGL
jgi:hypothetical protein